MQLAKYITARIALMVISLFLITTMIFFVTRFAQFKHWSIDLDLNQQFELAMRQYREFIVGVITRWDWGTSNGKPVWNALVEKAPNTLRLNILALMIYLPGGIIIGTITALRPKSIVNQFINVPLLIISSIPSFIWIFLFIIWFGYRLAWLPPQPPSSDAPLYWHILSWVIPVSALMIAPLAKFIQMIRSEIIENAHSEYIILLRAKGLNHNQIIRKHLIKDSLVAVMPELIPTFVFVMVGSFFVEMIYNLRGVSTLLFEAIFHPMMDSHFISFDTPMTVMVCVFYAAITIFFTLLVDISYAIIDPRIKVGTQTSH